jgi:hypothetical protein
VEAAILMDIYVTPPRTPLRLANASSAPIIDSSSLYERTSTYVPPVLFCGTASYFYRV